MRGHEGPLDSLVDHRLHLPRVFLVPDLDVAQPSQGHVHLAHRGFELRAVPACFCLQRGERVPCTIFVGFEFCLLFTAKAVWLPICVCVRVLVACGKRF